MDLRTYLDRTRQADFAEKLGVTQSLISQWLQGHVRITAERAVQIEKATGGLVSRSELRPDLFAKDAA